VIILKEDLKAKGYLWLLPGVLDILETCSISAGNPDQGEEVCWNPLFLELLLENAL